jgi:VWFA-related protein
MSKRSGILSTLILALLIAAVSWSAEPEGDEGAVIRLLPLRDGVKGGKALVEMLLIDPGVQTVVVYVDGEEAARRKFVPWEVKVKLASPAREQLIRAEALNERGEVVGSDEMKVNRVIRPLKVTLLSLAEAAGSLGVEAEVSIPEEATLERVEIFLNDDLAETVTPEAVQDGRLDLSISRPAPRAEDFVRVVAQLADGRSVEDTELVATSGFREEVDVRLVQLQVLVTDSQARPLKGLKKEHFQIREKKQVREAAGLFVADDVSLLFGLTIDSSGSMQPIWESTKQAAASFIDATLTERDQGFLIDFDTELRLVQGRTGEANLLRSGLEEFEPEGGTALYDAVLYSLLQFDRQQGRRGLVVVTDGFDVNSQSDPKRAVEFARKLGVPVYVLALEMSGAGAVRPGRGPSGAMGGGVGGPGAALQTLHLLTDPTGGRMFRARTLDQVTNALSLINADMRNQYVLTYYTDTPPEPGKPPEVRVDVAGRKGVQVKVVFGADQIY